VNEPLPSSSLILLCIDLQPVFLKAVAHGDVVQRRSAFAIRCAIGLGIPVVFSEQMPQKLGGTAAELLALAPEARVFGKETFSALACDAIRSAVTTHPAEHVLLCGIESSVCV
jgi:nicotinamidase-related amidase